MTNTYNQKLRDREKLVESHKAGYDKSGDMPWCNSCEFSTTCLTRVSGRRCDYGATAYNRMKRKEYLDSKNRYKKNCIEKSINLLNK